MLDKIKKTIRYLDKKTKIMLFSMLGVIVLIVILAILANLFKARLYSYAEVEDKMIAAAKAYYAEEENETSLPADGQEVIITVNTLVTDRYMKSLAALLKGGKDCTGEVRVSNASGVYTYLPYLNCGTAYYSSELYAKLIDKDVVTTGDGLYKIGEEYIYRGQNVNNYVSFANKTWRVVKIDANNQISLILSVPEKITTYVYDDRYNTDKENNFGINDFNVSRLKDSLVAYLDGENRDGSANFEAEDKARLVVTTLCTGNRSEEQLFSGGKVECNQTLEDMYVGLLNLYDYALASLDTTCTKPSDPQCQNYNYLGAIGNTGNSWWLMTGNSDLTYEAYRIKNTGLVEATRCNTRASLRPVVVINNKTFSNGGTGTLEDPYQLR